jgi:hypothetical protein
MARVPGKEFEHAGSQPFPHYRFCLCPLGHFFPNSLALFSFWRALCPVF